MPSNKQVAKPWGLEQAPAHRHVAPVCVSRINEDSGDVCSRAEDKRSETWGARATFEPWYRRALAQLQDDIMDSLTNTPAFLRLSRAPAEAASCSFIRN